MIGHRLSARVEGQRQLTRRRHIATLSKGGGAVGGTDETGEAEEANGPVWRGTVVICAHAAPLVGASASPRYHGERGPSRHPPGMKGVEGGRVT